MLKLNTVIRIFNYRFYLREFLILFFGYLLMEQIFSWLIAPTSVFVQVYQKIFGFVIYGLMLYLFAKLKTVEKVYVGAFTVLMIRLVLESLYKYDTFFEQLTMYYVLFPVVYTIFIKYISRTYELDLLEFMAKFYLVIYLVFMAIYGRGFSFSLEGLDLEDLGVFSGDGRIIHATSIYMMIIPFLWFLHKYITVGKLSNLLPLILCIVVIVIHQHRSVWSSAIFSLFVYFGISLRVNKNSISPIGRFIIGGIIVLGIVFFFVQTMFPDMVSFLAGRFSEIFDPAQQESTGRFRVEQRETYFKMFLDRPIFGWTFEGFEMPNPLVDWFPEKSGQHFHEGIMEVLFYHGIIGLVFKYSLLVYVAIRGFSKKLSGETIVLIAFCVSGFVFSLSYVPQTIFWGHVGLCLYYLERDDHRNSLPVLEEEETAEIENPEPVLEG